MMSAVMTPPAVSIPVERSDVEEKVLGLLRGVTREDGGLDGSGVRNSLNWVDGLVGLLDVEEVGDELDDFWDTSGTTDKVDLVDVGLLDLGITEDFLNWLQGAAEEILAELLEAGAGEGSVEVDAVEEIRFRWKFEQQRKGYAWRARRRRRARALVERSNK